MRRTFYKINQLVSVSLSESLGLSLCVLVLVLKLNSPQIDQQTRTSR